jgi:hypothetical protein
MRQALRDLRWAVPASLAGGLGLALLSPGAWWIGLIAYGLILLLGFSALAVLWRICGSTRAMGLMLLLAVLLRLGLGMTLSYVLPPYGNDTPVQNAGYIFSDAYQRDTQAWELASSDDSLLIAFNKSYASSDQYGGLLFTSSLAYRVLSPDAHRPWLVILLAALVFGIGVALAYRAARNAWGEQVGRAAGWILALFPEAVLLGAAQMREPFLMAFLAMGFWGALEWSERRAVALAWILGGLTGLLLFNPGVAIVGMILLAVWLWLFRGGRLRWWMVVAAGGSVLLTGLIFVVALRTGAPAGEPAQGGLLTRLVDWFRHAVYYDAYLQELNSGWLQTIFKVLPATLHSPFLVMYGVLQPVLPAAIADPAVWPMRVIGILRGLGWYALLPLLVYSLRPILKTPDRRERLAWLWLWLASGAWILLSSLRAGGDQWDNPRYRAILLLFQAALAARAVLSQRVLQDRWLGRVLAVEGVFLLFFGYWYIARYTHWAAGQVHIFVIMALIVVISGIIVVSGWLRDRRKPS